MTKSAFCKSFKEHRKSMFIRSFKHANHDPQMISIAEEGIKDYLSLFNK